MFDTRMRFTIGVSGTVDVPSAQTPARRATRSCAADALRRRQRQRHQRRQRTDPQQRAEEARKRAERVQACVQQAMRDNPTGGIATEPGHRGVCADQVEATRSQRMT